VPISDWIYLVVLLGAVPTVIFYFALEPARAQQGERRDILSNGLAAMGTVVAIIGGDPAPKGGVRYTVTVEFTPPGYPEPTQFAIELGSHAVNKLGIYQQVPIHYREQNPSEAVIDEFLK
jgi:hypothetical protein